MHRIFLPSPDRDVVQRTLAFEPGGNGALGGILTHDFCLSMAARLIVRQQNIRSWPGLFGHRPDLESLTEAKI